MTNWVLVSSADNFETSRARGFDIAGMKSRHRKKAERVAPGDKVFFYATVVKCIAGMAEVTGDYYEDHEKIWESNRPGEVYPFRFPIKILKARPKDKYLELEPIFRTLEYPKRWPEKNWTLAFQGNVHMFSDEDAKILEDAL
jgi:hypothetical protein